MSRFRPRRIYLSVETDRLALVSVSGGWHPRIDADRMIDVVDEPRGSDMLLAALAETVSAEPWKDANVHIVLSSQLVKQLVVDTVPGIETLRELQQSIEARVIDTFGLPPEEWEIRCSLAPFVQRVFACAAPRSLLQGLHSVLAAAGCTVSAIEPFLVSEFNRWHRQVAPPAAWFGVLERHSLGLALFNNGHWQGVRTHRIQDDLPTILTTALARDRLRHDLPDATSHVYLSGLGCDAEITGALPTTIPLALGAPIWPNRSEQWSRDFRLALSPLWP